MKKIILLSLIGAFVGVASAAPVDEKPGICYQFSGSKLINKSTCIISSGYGAGGSYNSIQIGKKEYTAETSTCYDSKKDESVECNTELNGKSAMFYNRDLFYKVIANKNLINENSLSCYQTLDKKTDICFK